MGIFAHHFQDVWNWVWERVRGDGNLRSLGACRETLKQRLMKYAHLRYMPNRWNTTQYRRAFSLWTTLFVDLLPEHFVVVPMAASIISCLLYRPHPLEDMEICALLCWSFVLRIFINSNKCSLYWHSLIRQLIPVFRRLGCSPLSLSEEIQESMFRPVKVGFSCTSATHP